MTKIGILGYKIAFILYLSASQIFLLFNICDIFKINGFPLMCAIILFKRVCNVCLRAIENSIFGFVHKFYLLIVIYNSMVFKVNAFYIL